MEQEFDKEIDALLRKLRPAGFSSDATVASAHLEADEVAAFAENALPEAARQTLTLHLADCGRCRKILSETILMNSEAAPVGVAAAAAPAVEIDVPWYRRLFLFPNLAYVMGGLVLVFSGFLGYVALRDKTGEATVSQVAYDPMPAASGPSAEQPEYSTSEGMNANAAANAASTAANTTVSRESFADSNTVPPPTGATPGYGADAKREDAPTGGSSTSRPVIDGVSAGQPAPPAATDMTIRRDERGRTISELSKEKDDDKMAASKADAPKMAQEQEEAKLRAAPRTSTSGPMKKSAPVGPSRDMQAQFPDRAQNMVIPYQMKNAGGKKFELRDDGVWYDTAYKGQSTTVVRRGTEAFLRLDSGLRSIAETVGGTSVIMWNGRAYRIH